MNWTGGKKKTAPNLAFSTGAAFHAEAAGSRLLQEQIYEGETKGASKLPHVKGQGTHGKVNLGVEEEDPGEAGGGGAAPDEDGGGEQWPLAVDHLRFAPALPAPVDERTGQTALGEENGTTCQVVVVVDKWAGPNRAGPGAVGLSYREKVHRRSLNLSPSYKIVPQPQN